jgi:hypothetical protein
VADGDTITVLDENRHQHKIRLAGIDAPEKAQDFGQRSKQSLSDQAYRQHVMVETGKTDRYGRLVGKVLVNGQDVNLEQVRRGMAWHYKAYQREQAPADRPRPTSTPRTPPEPLGRACGPCRAPCRRGSLGGEEGPRTGDPVITLPQCLPAARQIAVIVGRFVASGARRRGLLSGTARAGSEACSGLTLDQCFHLLQFDVYRAKRDGHMA